MVMMMQSLGQFHNEETISSLKGHSAESKLNQFRNQFNENTFRHWGGKQQLDYSSGFSEFFWFLDF